MPLRRFLGSLAFALLLSPAIASAQNTGTIRGRVTESKSNLPLAGVQISVDGTRLGTQSSTDGSYTITGVPTGQQTLTARRVGYSPQKATLSVGTGATNTHNFTLTVVATTLNDVVVTALGQTTAMRSLGTAQQAVTGSAIAETQRENFVNSLQGRVAGVQVVSSSGVPGASTSITIRGVSSISGSNQPLMIIDGLPMDNKTLNTSQLASDAPGSATAPRVRRRCPSGRFRSTPRTDPTCT